MTERWEMIMGRGDTRIILQERQRKSNLKPIVGSKREPEIIKSAKKSIREREFKR